MNAFKRFYKRWGDALVGLILTVTWAGIAVRTGGAWWAVIPLSVVAAGMGWGLSTPIFQDMRALCEKSMAGWQEANEFNRQLLEQQKRRDE